MDNSLFQLALITATLLCSLVAGLLFTFAVVVMPGIRDLDDGAFIRAFQAIDGVIQRNQPLFMLVWVGSVLAMVAAALLGLSQLDGANRLLLIATALLYLLGVQLPTFSINVPLNNEIKKLAPHAMNEASRKQARDTFEARWNRSNVFRTVCASLASLLLLLLLAGVQ